MNSLCILFAVALALGLTSCTKTKNIPGPVQKQNIPPTLYVTVENDPVADCEAFRRALPEGYYNDWIEVPENWNEPDGRKIKVFYYGRNPTLGKDLAIFFNGGPGMSSHTSFEALDKNEAVKDRWEKIDMVYMDQRGTGCSDPFPSDPKEAQRLQHYGSRSIVLDAEAIRKHAFQSRKWKAIGQSYGGDIVYRYAIIAPESLLGAFVHGSTIADHQAIDTKDRLGSQKRISDEYFKRYPEDLAKLAFIRTTLMSGYCISNRISGACGPAIMDAGVYMLSFQNQWEELHTYLTSLISKKPGRPDGVYDDVLIAWMQRTMLSRNNYLLGSAIGELEQTHDSQAGCVEAEAHFRKKGNDPAKWPFNECRLFKNYISEEDTRFEPFKGKDPLRLSELKQSLTKNPELKIYVYLGRLDALAPIEGGPLMERMLKDRLNITYFNDSGHEGINTEPTIWADLAK